ncbi:hypothetical protein [Streptomyces sp. NPDC057363]|uniref:hypothetical protein n=1 Tax=Streptomyces sp. NPDC057363 TaxID=3346107 RepID=UPI00363CE74B
MSAVFAAALFAGGTVACGEGSVSDSANQDQPEMTPAMAVEKAAQKSEDIAALHYRITGTVPEKGRLEAEASMRTEPLAMSMRMSTADQDQGSRSEIRFIDGVMYFGGSAFASGEVGGKSWFRADPAVWGLSTVDNDSYGVLPRQLEGSPVVQSTILTASKDVRKLGTEGVDGTRTTHYRGKVTSRDMRAARNAAADESTRERRIKSFEQFLGLRVEGALTIDLWIDDTDNTKQFRMRGDTYGTRGGSEGEPLELVAGDPLDLTITFLDINPRVTFEAPPVEDTADLGAMADEALSR